MEPGNGNPSTTRKQRDLESVKDLIQKLDSNVRAGIQKQIEATEIPNDKIEVINFTHLSGMCGDNVVGVNLKFGAVYYHVYVLDEGCDPQVVKVLGPKETSVIITGFH